MFLQENCENCLKGAARRVLSLDEEDEDEDERGRGGWGGGDPGATSPPVFINEFL